LVSPEEFIRIAEETGLIISFSEWIFRKVCQQIAIWQTEGLPPLRVSVNLSAVQFNQKDLPLTIKRIIQETGVSPSQLEIEITESMLMREPEMAVQRLRAVKGLGIRIAIDDFGTGYSSLNYLRRFPVDILKIDVDVVAAGPEDAALANAIVRLANTLQLGTVAEGIETEEQLAELRLLGCELGQGYLFARPLPGDGMAELLRTAGPLPRVQASGTRSSSSTS
jgi:EAL domain-containing protein (putative c-di-GMP-specific phosphodiesterase class I)